MEINHPLTVKTPRRKFLKASVLAGISLQLPAWSFNIIHRPKLASVIIGHGDFQYRVHESWGNLDPTKTPVNNCHEMVMDAKGRLIMVTDEPRNNIIVYDKSGKLVTSWGSGYKSAHGLSIFDEGGEDVLWVCNPDHEAPSVTKTTLTGKLIMALPDPRKIGAYAEKDRYLPTETAVSDNGDIYVSDGYGSQWILQFDKNGKFIRKFGGPGDGDSQFSTAHGVAIDRRQAGKPTLLCTSRGHNAFKRFSLDGRYLETVFLPGAYVCRPVIDGENVYAGVCWSRLRYLNQTPNSGFITILDQQNRVVSNPGGTKPTYVDNKLQLMVQQQTLFKHCHDVCVDEDKNLYVCQWNANKSYPIKLERV